MFDVGRKLLFLLSRQDRWKLALLFVAMLMGAVLEMAGLAAIPGFVLLLANPAVVMEHELTRTALQRLGITPDERFALYAAVALVILFVLKNGFLALLAYVQLRFARSRGVGIGTRLFRAYMLAPYVHHLQRSPAELLRNVANETQTVINGLLLPLLVLVKEAMLVAAVLALLLLADPLISVGAFLTLGAASAVFYRSIRKRLSIYGAQGQRYRGQLIKSVSHGLGAIKDAKILGREAFFVESFTHSAEGLAQATQFSEFMRTLPRLFLETVALIGLLGVCAIFILQGRAIDSMLPVLSLFAVSVVRMIPSFNLITASFTQVRYGRFAVDVVYDELLRLERDAQVSAARPAVDRSTFNDSIELRDVHFGYPSGEDDVLRGISLTIPRGAAVAFVGTTGAGKTTLANVILGLLEPTSGDFRVDDRPVERESWRRHLGYVPQEIYLCDDTIRRNIALGLPDAAIDEEAVRRAVEAASLDVFIQTLPAGLDTVVGDRGMRLSGGQRQRIGIARALYHDPDVLVMDEATSSLDNQTERFVMEAVERLRGERTVILIAHRLSTVRDCDTLFYLEHGRVAGKGSFAELLRTNHNFSDMAAATPLTEPFEATA